MSQIWPEATCWQRCYRLRKEKKEKSLHKGRCDTFDSFRVTPLWPTFAILSPWQNTELVSSSSSKWLISQTRRRDPHLRYYSAAVAATSTLTILVISEVCFWEALVSLRNFNSLWNPKSELYLLEPPPRNDRCRRQTESRGFTVQPLVSAELVVEWILKKKTTTKKTPFRNILDVLIEIPFEERFINTDDFFARGHFSVFTTLTRLHTICRSSSDIPKGALMDSGLVSRSRILVT